MGNKNIVLTQMTKEQRDWLKQEAKKMSTTITGLVKYWCQRGIEKEENV